MSLLFPLYALAALALAGPIIFHLFQRRPHGQQEFSSLMFLKETPPRLTRRSRLSDLLLLLLRACVLLLLAAAFARPFLRSTSMLELEAPTRSVALLVDTSASMRRADLWDQTQKAIQEVVKDLRPTDQVSLVQFDRSPTTLISFEAWQQTEASRRIPLLNEQLRGLEPSWYATDFSSAAIEASDALLQQRLVEDHIQPVQAIVFTDLQEGSDLTGLQSYEWPEEVAIDVRKVAPKETTNASIQALPPESSEIDSTQVRVLVRNEADSNRGQFQLQWSSSDGDPVDIYVPPGQTRVVRVTQPRGDHHLSLLGDDHDFDNQLYLTETTPAKKQLWYFGEDATDEKQNLMYYLKQSALDTRTREVTVRPATDGELATVLPKLCPLVVLSQPLKGSAAEDLSRYAKRGGRVLFVLDKRSDTSSTVEFLRGLLGVEQLAIAESPQRDYAMLADIDFQHPIFQPFADPRFNDFTKIQFWSHRAMTSADEEPWKVVAAFDDDTPALTETAVGEGVVWVLTSGWQPEDSQLAMSSKFVPLLHGFFGTSSAALVRSPTHYVGDAISLTASAETTTIVGPSGETFELEANATAFTESAEPGIYEVTRAGAQFDLAVNVSAAESKTLPLEPDRLAQLGLKIGKQKSVSLLESEQRQMRSKELESKQKLWRWGILVALGVVAIETVVGGLSVRPLATS